MATDANGSHPDDSDFDPKSMTTFGTENITAWLFMMPLLYSNNAALFSEDGMSIGLDTDEAKEVLQALHDLMYVDTVAPTGATAEALPGDTQLFKNKQLGMVLTGSWAYLSFMNEGIDVGLAPLPRIKNSKTISWASCNQISAESKNIEEAYQFLKYFANPETNILQVKTNFPNIKSFYEEENMKLWTSGEMYSDDFKKVVPLTMDGSVALIPENVTIKNFGTIMDEVYTPVLDKLWLDEASVDEVVEEIIEKSAGMYQGRWN